MATQVKTVTPVDSISGMLGKREDFVSKKAFICNVSKRGNVNSKGSYMYLSLRSKDRITGPSTAEAANRTKFATAAANARAALRDPSQLAQLQADFLAQKKYPTLYGYVFSVEYAKL